MRVWVLDTAGEVRNPLWDATYIIVLDEVTHTRLALLSNYYRGNKPVDGTPVHVITLLAVERDVTPAVLLAYGMIGATYHSQRRI